MMKTYIGTKIVNAEPMSERDWVMESGRVEDSAVDEVGASPPGYRVVYPDGYASWCPKDAFENVYRELSPEEAKHILPLMADS